MTRHIDERDDVAQQEADGRERHLMRRRRMRGDAILDQDAVISERVRMPERRLDADIGLHAGENEGADAAGLQLEIEPGTDEAVIAVLVDHALAGLRLNAVPVMPPGTRDA